MVWGKAGSTTLSSAGDSVDIGTITASETMNTMFHVINNGSTTDGTLRFNNNSSANYPSRWSNNGGSENTATNHTYTLAGYWGSEDTLGINYICNVSGEEKLSIMFAVARGSATASGAPNRREAVGKFTETTGQITDVEGFNEQAGSFDTDTNLTVLGSDITPAPSTPAVPAIPALLPVVGGWKEVARHTLGSNANPILASSIPDKRYYMVLYHTKHSSGSWNQPRVRFGNGSTDAGSNYTQRYVFDYASSDTTTAPNTYFLGWAGSGNNPNQPLFGMFHVANKSDKEKLVIHHATDNDATGNSDAPRSVEQVAKWTNISNVIDRIELNSASGSSNFTSGDEVVVLGWDPDDNHTDNFWEELANVNLASAGDNISSGTFTAKKYLWVQCFMEQTNNTITGNITFNGDTGGNYCRRRSNNGGSQSVGLGENSIDVRGGESKNRFENMFIKNIAGDEKLVIGHHVVTTAGDDQTPDRTEYKAKWTNTSNQITSINFNNIDSGDYGTKSFIRVWGHD